MLNRLASWCSTAEHCTEEARKKITASGLDRTQSARIISRLISERFIDDKRYTKCYVSDKLRFNGYGKIKMRFELQHKHIDKSIIDEALNAIDEQQYVKRLFDMLKAKRKTLKGNDQRELFQKLVRFAAARGFESKFIFEQMKLILNYDIDENDYPQENSE